jgi:hypothetical protein
MIGTKRFPLSCKKEKENNSDVTTHRFIQIGAPECLKTV